MSSPLLKNMISSKQQDLVDHAISMVKHSFQDGVEDAIRFIKQYYNAVPAFDIEATTHPDQLYRSTISLWKFIANRNPGKTKVRAYNPHINEHGWAGEHTVIEVVSDDMPFIVDSVTTALTSLDMKVLLSVHPVITVIRDKAGIVSRLLEREPDDTQRECGNESVIHIEIIRHSDQKFLNFIAGELESVLLDVNRAVADWGACTSKTAEIIDELNNTSGIVHPQEAKKTADFLSWIAEDHFTFLGYRPLVFSQDQKKFGVDNASSQEEPTSALTKNGLGVLRNPDYLLFDELQHLEDLPSPMRAFLNEPTYLLITKSSSKARVHRSVFMDVIVSKKFSDTGELIGLHMIAGLFTSNVYTNSASFVPLLRDKIDRIMERADVRPHSHDAKRLLNILENLERDELFQARDDKLLEISVGILDLQDRSRTAIFLRSDRLERFVSAMVFVPSDRYDTALRLKIQHILETTFNGTQATYFTQVSNDPLARLHFIIRTKPGQLPEVNQQRLQDQIAAITRVWRDDLYEVVLTTKGEEQAARLSHRYLDGFPSAYREHTDPQTAVFDIDRMEEALGSQSIVVNLYRRLEASATEINFKIYLPNQAASLSEVLPMLESMGFRVIGETSHEVWIDGDEGMLWIHDFTMRTTSGLDVELDLIHDVFHETFVRLWHGEVEKDGFNQLVTAVGMPWREVAMLRAYAKYLRQIAFTFSQVAIESALANHPTFSSLLVKLFHADLDPKGDPGEGPKARDSVVAALNNIANPDEDRILRQYINLIQNTLRTNFYQADDEGVAKGYISFKINSQNIKALPLPRPMVEVWVYSPRVEGIHLRGGKVARGGIRWSDRREDFRTEILGLVKAQMVKNAVIVPVGSKGGFVVKKPPTDREAAQAEGVECYKILIRGLLDITDNLVAGNVLGPPDVKRRDGDDPYLVVAADKGTATFSDTANALSEQYGFWLGDAFASGGAQGYDHKTMGITARGAWEAVKRHFREMDHDIQTQDFTVAGCGDMSGDVFGNGMLLSQHIRLVAAFNHQHIFIDPDPDPESSFLERERLFKLPRSSWGDYNSASLSTGGGVFKRSAKQLHVSDQIQTLLDLTSPDISPPDLIKAILGAKVDLLWFGGIGTYIKASDETNFDVGDRANDWVRVDAPWVKAKVIGEGANLGVTQKSRIELASAGGCRLNTDAIDNSAGVDCSDHEVNIKILLNQAVADGDMTIKQRNALLVEMTEEVGELVLRDNYLQTEAISLARGQNTELLDYHARMIRMLERSGHLDRGLEFLPNEEEIAERQAERRGLSRPELAVLIAYSKLWLFDEILGSDLPDDPSMEQDLINYFPKPLRETHRRWILDHKLRREIIATHATNSMINRVGATFVSQIMIDEPSASPSEVARAYIIAREAYDLRSFWTNVQSLDAQAAASAQLAMLEEANRLVERVVLWILRNVPRPWDQKELISTISTGARAMRGRIDGFCTADLKQGINKRRDTFITANVPEQFAEYAANMIVLASAPDMVRLSEDSGVEVLKISTLYFVVGSHFGLGWLRGIAESLNKTGSHWDKIASASIIRDLHEIQRSLTSRIAVCDLKADSAPQLVVLWAEQAGACVRRAEETLAELRNAPSVTLAMLVAFSRQFGAICRQITV